MMLTFTASLTRQCSHLVHSLTTPFVCTQQKLWSNVTVPFHCQPIAVPIRFKHDSAPSLLATQSPVDKNPALVWYRLVDSQGEEKSSFFVEVKLNETVAHIMDKIKLREENKLSKVDASDLAVYFPPDEKTLDLFKGPPFKIDMNVSQLLGFNVGINSNRPLIVKLPDTDIAEFPNYVLKSDLDIYCNKCIKFLGKMGILRNSHEYDRLVLPNTEFANVPAMDRNAAFAKVFNHFLEHHNGRSKEAERRFFIGAHGPPGGGKSRFLDEVAKFDTNYIKMALADPENIPADFMEAMTRSKSVSIKFNGDGMNKYAPKNQLDSVTFDRNLVVQRLLYSFFIDPKSCPFETFLAFSIGKDLPPLKQTLAMIYYNLVSKEYDYDTLLSFTPKPGNSALKPKAYLLLCLDEVQRTGRESFILSVIGQALNDLPWFLFLFSLTSREAIPLEQSVSRRFTEWAHLNLLTYESSLKLFKDEIEKRSVEQQKIIRRFLLETAGHPRTLEEFHQLLRSEAFTVKSMSALLDNVVRSPSLNRLWNELPIGVLFAAIRGLSVTESSVLDVVGNNKSITAAAAIQNSYILNSLHGMQMIGGVPELFVPRISILALRFCNDKRYCSSMRDAVLEMIHDDAPDVSGQALERLQYRSEIVRRMAWDPKNSPDLWSLKEWAYSEKDVVKIQLGELYHCKSFGTEIIVTQKWGGLCQFNLHCSTAVNRGQFKVSEKDLLTHVYRFSSNNPGFDTMLFELKPNGELVVVFIENRYSLDTTDDSKQSSSETLKKWGHCETVFKKLILEIPSLVTMYLIVAAYRDTVEEIPLVLKGQVLCLNRTNMNNIFTPSLSSLAMLYVKPEDNAPQIIGEQEKPSNVGKKGKNKNASKIQKKPYNAGTKT